MQLVAIQSSCALVARCAELLRAMSRPRACRAGTNAVVVFNSFCAEASLPSVLLAASILRTNEHRHQLTRRRRRRDRSAFVAGMNGTGAPAAACTPGATADATPRSLRKNRSTPHFVRRNVGPRTGLGCEPLRLAARGPAATTSSGQARVTAFASRSAPQEDRDKISSPLLQRRSLASLVREELRLLS